MLPANHVFSADPMEIAQASSSIVEEQQIDETSIEANASITATTSIDQPTVMQHLTQQWQDVLFENLRNLRRVGKLCDVSLITKNANGDDATFMAHSVILVAASPYLAQELEKAGISESAVGLNMVHVPEAGIGPILDLLYGTIVSIRDADHLRNVKLAASLLGVLNLHNFLQSVEVGEEGARFPIRLQHHKVLSYGPSRRGWLPQKNLSKSCQTEAVKGWTSDLHIDEYVYQRRQESDTDIKCPYCSLLFTNKVFYLSHLSRIHPTSKGEFWFSCPTCREAFLSCLQYRQHLEFHPLPNSSVSTQKKAMTSPKTASFLCQQCGKICLSSVRLSQHMRIHLENPKKVACPVCDLQFNTSADMAEHVVSQHSDHNDNICELCSKAFSTKRMLKSHKMFAHAISAVKLHHCQFCDDGFEDISALREHLKTHTTKNPVKTEVGAERTFLTHDCHWCEKKYRKPCQLRNHMKKCSLKPAEEEEQPPPTTERSIQIELPLDYIDSNVPITIELPEGMELPPEIVLPSGENPVHILAQDEEEEINILVKQE